VTKVHPEDADKTRLTGPVPEEPEFELDANEINAHLLAAPSSKSLSNPYLEHMGTYTTMYFSFLLPLCMLHATRGSAAYPAGDEAL